MSLSPPVPKDWVARYDPSPLDFNTYIRDTFNYLAGPPRLRAIQNAIQTGIAPVTWTTIVLQNVLEDNYSGWTSGTSNYYQAQVPGWYGITFMAQAALPTTNVARVGLTYRIKGTTAGPFEFNQQEAGLNPWGWDLYDEAFLNIGDMVYPQFFQENSAAISTSLASPSALEIVWLSL